MVYRGRIDDRYVELGRDRTKPTRMIWKTRSTALIAGKPVALRETRAVGCIPVGPDQMMQRAGCAAAVAVHAGCTLCTLCTSCAARVERSRVTFSRDVAPIVFDACVSCHRSGGPGPFPLTTYDEVRRRATQIAQVTRSRFMPPWKVEPGVGHFVGQRPLDRREIATDRAMGEERHARRRSADAAGAAEVRRRLAARQTRSDRQARRGVLAARRSRPTPSASSRFALPVTKRTYVHRHRVPSRQRARRASRQHPHRSHAGDAHGSTRPIRCPATTA